MAQSGHPLLQSLSTRPILLFLFFLLSSCPLLLVTGGPAEAIGQGRVRQRAEEGEDPQLLHRLRKGERTSGEARVRARAEFGRL